MYQVWNYESKSRCYRLSVVFLVHQLASLILVPKKKKYLKHFFMSKIIINDLILVTLQLKNSLPSFFWRQLIFFFYFNHMLHLHIVLLYYKQKKGIDLNNFFVKKKYFRINKSIFFPFLNFFLLTLVKHKFHIFQIYFYDVYMKQQGTYYRGNFNLYEIVK